MTAAKPPVMQPEEFVEFVNKCKGWMTEAERIGTEVQTLKTLVPQLSLAIAGVQQHAMEQPPPVPSGTEGDIVRSYVNTSANREDLPLAVARGVDGRARPETSQVWADKGQTIDSEEGRVFLASKDHGVVRMLGGVDEMGVYEPGLLDDTPKTEWQAELQFRMQIAAWHRIKSGNKSVPRGVLRAIARHMARGPKAVARVFSDNAGEGGEWIVTIPMAQLERTMELARQLEAVFPSMTLDGPANTHPFLTTGIQPFLHNTQASGDNNPTELPKSVPVTGERSVAPKTITAVLPYDLDDIEDSIVAFMPVANDLIARGLTDAFEDALINGDTAATHGDTAFGTWNPRSRWQVLGSPIDHRRWCIGLRQRAFDVDATVSTAVTDYNALQTVSDYMGALAGLSAPHAFGDILYLTSPEHFLAKILRDTNLLTVDKYGPSATVLTGEVGKIGGRRLLLSEFVTSDLAASGLYTGAGALTCMLIVNVARFRVARRRGVLTTGEIARLRNTGYLIATERKTLHTFDGSGIANVRNLINLSSS